MYNRLKWFIHLQAQDLSKGDEHPAYTPHGLLCSLPSLLWSSLKLEPESMVNETGGVE